MPNIGSTGVANYTNTTSASATGVVATGGIGDSTVVAYPIPATTGLLISQDGLYLITQDANYLITEN